MKTYLMVSIAMLTGMAVGGVAVRGLHAQGGKLKAYSVGEVERVGTAPIPPISTPSVRR